MRRIVLGYAGWPAAERALERVVELALALDASVVVAAWAPEHAGGGEVRPVGGARAAERLNELGIPARVAPGPVYATRGLRELAESTAADLLVVGVNGLRVGSGIWEAAACDVLLVH
jgi:hypothetical protein